MRDPSIVPHVEARLEASTYAGIGEFHVLGAGADLTPLLSAGHRFPGLSRTKVGPAAHSCATTDVGGERLRQKALSGPVDAILWPSVPGGYPGGSAAARPSGASQGPVAA